MTRPSRSDHPKSAIRRALAVGEFRRLFFAQTISRWGDVFSAVALVIVVYRLTGSGIQVGGIVAMEIAPVLLLGVVAGTVVDRLPRARVMVAADLGRGLIAALLVLGPENLWALYLAAFGLSAFAVFFNPAAASVVPTLVAETDLVGANSAVWSAAVLSQIVLAPVAGALVALTGPGAAFAINSASFFVSAALLGGMRVPAMVAPAAEKRWAQVVEGIHVIRRSRFHATLAIVQTLAALSAGATSALLVVLAAQHLDVGPSGFGLLIGAIGIGAGIGPLVLQRFVTDVRHPTFLFGPYLLRGLVDIVLAATSSFALALGALAAYGLGTSTGTVTFYTALQTTTPDHLRGRVFAFYDVLWQTARLASIAIGAVLADTLGIRGVYLAGGVLLIAAGSLGYLRVPPAEMTRPSLEDRSS